jgi:hypothetical protein
VDGAVDRGPGVVEVDPGQGGGATYVVPWDQIALVADMALVAALAMTIIISRQAGRVMPAETLRYE